MQQTLLALLGLLIITMLNFSQQQSRMRSQQQAIQEEYQQMALGVAKLTIEVVRNRTFDQSLLSDEDTEVANFTEEASSDWGGKDNCIDQVDGDWQFTNNCSAIEHFHDDETRAMDNADGVIDVQVPGHTVYFQVEVEVHYAEQDGSTLVRADASDAPTSLKEVTVRVQDCPGGGASGGDSCEGTPYLDPPIVFSEVLGYTN